MPYEWIRRWRLPLAWRIAIVAASWLIVISALHYGFNIEHSAKKVVRLGYMPVISNLAAPLLDYASRNHTYDNTTNNPANPTSPPKFVTWGEGTKDETYYLPIFYVPYKTGDEDIIFNESSTSVDDLKSKHISGRIFPNPVTKNQASRTQIAFHLTSGFPVKIDIMDAAGMSVRNIRDNEYFGQGDHTIHLETQPLPKGTYFVKISGNQDQLVLPLLIVE